MSKPLAQWPDPPAEQDVRSHELMRASAYNTFVAAAGFTPEESETAQKIIADMNREIAQLFTEMIEPSLSTRAPLPEESRTKYLETWVAAMDRAQEAIVRINDRAPAAIESAAFVAAGQLDIQNTQRHLTFYERYQKGTPEDLVVTKLIEEGAKGQ